MTFENGITLGDGSIYFAGFGIYQPNLGFIVSTDDPHYNKETGCLSIFVDLDLPEGSSLKLREELNLKDSSLNGRIFGDYFVSKKGTKMFRIKADGKDQLLCDDWGGCFNSYRGGVLPQDGSLHYRRASSNGGGCGCDYAVYPRNWKRTMTVDDL